MNDQQKQYVLRGATIILVVCLVVWGVLLFLPSQEEAKPSLIEALQPQYDYDDQSFIQQNPDLFLSQLLPLLGAVELAVQEDNQGAVDTSVALLQKELVRWKDATPVAILQTSIQRYISAAERVPGGDARTRRQALATLGEIKTLAQEARRNTLESLTE